MANHRRQATRKSGAKEPVLGSIRKRSKTGGSPAGIAPGLSSRRTLPVR